MAAPEAESTNPRDGDVQTSAEKAEGDVQQPESPLDPKEEARRRSKEDLARKRRGLHNSRGKR